MAKEVLELLRRGRWLYKPGPESNNGDGGQESASGEDQESSKPGDKKVEGQGPKTYDETYVTNLRREAADYRTRLKELETTAGSETTKLRTDLDKALAELTSIREERRTAAFMAAAQREGAKYPDAVAALIPADTKPEDLAAAIKALRKTHADLFVYQDGDGGRKGKDTTDQPSPGLGTLRAAYAEKEKKES